MPWQRIVDSPATHAVQAVTRKFCGSVFTVVRATVAHAELKSVRWVDVVTKVLE